MGRVNLEHQRGGVGAKPRSEIRPRQRAATGRQVKVEPQRVQLRCSGSAAAGAEVVVQVEDRNHVEDRLDQLTDVGMTQVADDVRVAEVEAEPDRRRGELVHE